MGGSSIDRRLTGFIADRRCLPPGNGLNVPCGWRRNRARHGGRLHCAESSRSTTAQTDGSTHSRRLLRNASFSTRPAIATSGSSGSPTCSESDQSRVIAKLVRALKHGGPLRITDSTRTFASIGELASTVVTDDQPGVSIVGRNVLRLTDLCHMLMEITGLEAEIQISDAPDPDACGIVMPQREHVPGNFERDLRTSYKHSMQSQSAALRALASRRDPAAS